MYELRDSEVGPIDYDVRLDLANPYGHPSTVRFEDDLSAMGGEEGHLLSVTVPNLGLPSVSGDVNGLPAHRAGSSKAL